MPTHDQPVRYHSFLIRFWQERAGDGLAPPVWRFSLEEPRTGERLAFASLDAVVEVLRQRMGDAPTS